MNALNRQFLIIAFILAATLSSYGKENTGGAVSFEHQYRVTYAPKTKQVYLTVELPGNVANCQQISDLTYSTKPVKVKTVGNNQYATFHLKEKHRNIVIKITGKAKLSGWDLARAKTKGKSAARPTVDKSQYLQAEKHIEVNDPAVQKAAAKLSRGSREKTVLAIHRFVGGKLKYQYNENIRGAKAALADGVGDCDEYTALFIALCRAKKIPARWLGGQTTSWVETPDHSWAEVYFDDYGWVPFDPTINEYFSDNPMILKRIYFRQTEVSKHKSPIKESNDYIFKYWGAKPKISYDMYVKNISVPNYGPIQSPGRQRRAATPATQLRRKPMRKTRY